MRRNGRTMSWWAAAALAATLSLAAAGAAAGEATVLTGSAMELRIGQIRGVSGSLATLDGAGIEGSGAALEGVAQVRPGSVPGQASVTVQWNALRVGDRRVVLATPAVSTFDVITSELPGSTPITIGGDTTAIRTALQRAGIALPAAALTSGLPADQTASPLAAGSTAAGTGAAGSAATPAGAAAGTAETGAGAAGDASSASARPTPSYSGAVPYGSSTQARPTPSYLGASPYSAQDSAGGLPPSALLGSSPFVPPTPSTAPSSESNGAPASGTQAGGVAAAPASGPASPETTSPGTSPGADAGTGTVPGGGSSTVAPSTDGSRSAFAGTGTTGSDESQASAGEASGNADRSSITGSDTGEAGGAPAGDTAPPGNAGTTSSTQAAAAGADPTVPAEGAPIERSSFVCEPEPSIEAVTVVDRYRRYRIAPDGAPTWIDAGCLRDEATVRALGATTTGCAPLIDLDHLEATELKRRTYTHPAGGVAYATPCLDLGDSRHFQITYTPLGCRLQHEWDLHRTIGLQRPVYKVDGTEYAAGGCADRDGQQAIFEHIVETCPDLVVTVNGVVRHFAQSRTLIATSPPREIVPCEPVPSDTVVATGPGGALYLAGNADNDGHDLVLDGCDAVYVHDMDARVSFATRRWYLRVGSGLEVGTDLAPLTDCMLNPLESYDHAYVYTGWRNDDAAEVAFRQADVFVTLPGHGDVTIATGVEPDGPEDYAPAGREIQLTDQRFHIGCDEYQGRHWVETLERPDGSTLAVDAGAAAPVLVASCRVGRLTG